MSPSQAAVAAVEAAKPLKAAEREFRRAYVLYVIQTAGSKNKAAKILGFYGTSRLYAILNRPLR